MERDRIAWAATPALSGPESLAGGAPIRLRPAAVADRDLLLGWANDPDTRARSFHPQAISAETHRAWLAARLADPDSRIWIGESGGVPVGQVRAQRGPEGRVELGISVARTARGRRLSAPLLLAGMAAAGRELGATAFIALVRPDNEASLRLFRGAGFIDKGRGERAGVACLRLERAALDDPPGAPSPQPGDVGVDA
jgi:RimJ/RimL family protein N-acetyltransferase